MMTVRQALDRKREDRKGDVTALVLCKHELFYLPSRGNLPADSVYPVSWDAATREAEFFGVPVSSE
jgi:hypothetical protein